MATPTEIIDDARQYVSSLKTSADTALTSAFMWVDATGGRYIDRIPSEFVIKGVTKIEPPTLAPSMPTFDVINLNLPPDPGVMDALDVIPAYTQQKTPEFTEVAPVYVAPTLVTNLEPFRGAAPSINTNIDFPAPPDKLENPVFDEVTFEDHIAPEKLQLTLPALPGAAPSNTAVQPTNLDAKFKADYASARNEIKTLASSYVDEMIAKYAPNHAAGMATLEARLQTYLDGGTGLAPAVEDAIYARARGKNDAEARRVRDQALSDAATRGFTLPTGALMSAMQQARQGGADNNARAASEIVVQQAELEQKNLQFAVTTSAALRATVLQLTNSWLQGLVAINGQAIESAKAILSAVIEAYNTAVKAYMASLDAWKAEITMFDSLLRVELAKVEIYKADISALLAEYSVDQMKVDKLKAQISATTALAEMYKGQISAAMGQVSLEKLKIDIFQSQVSAYSAQVQQKEAEWRGFSAQIGGFAAESQAYSSRVSAYSSQLQAFKTDIDAKLAEMNAVSAKNQSTAEGYRSKVSAYTANVQAESASNSANIQTQNQKTLLYKAQLDERSANYSSNLAYYKTEADRVMEEAREKFNAAAKKAELFLKLSEVSGGIYKEIGTIQGGMAQAALAGMNTLAASTETI